MSGRLDYCILYVQGLIKSKGSGFVPYFDWDLFLCPQQLLLRSVSEMFFKDLFRSGFDRCRKSLTHSEKVAIS